MAVAARLEQTYRVRFDESGPDGTLPGSGFLRYAQDLAWVHSEAAGFGRAWYRERGLTWLIRAVELDVLDEIDYGTEVDASTEVLGFRRVWARRRSEFTRRSTERDVAGALIDWVLLNERGSPVRVPAEIVGLFGDDSRDAFTPLKVGLPAAPTDASSFELSVHRGELDPMGHVNNAAYLDYMDDHLVSAGRTAEIGRLPRRYRVEFVAPAEPGMSLVGRAWDDGLAWCYRLETADGRELVRARLETDPALWVGG
jgi:acyl-ACP thioesterase